MVKLIDIHGPGPEYFWNHEKAAQWHDERGLSGLDCEIPYEVMVYIEKIEANQQRKPEEHEHVCHNCDGSGWSS